MRTTRLALLVLTLISLRPAWACPTNASPGSCEGGPSLWSAISITSTTIAAVPGLIAGIATSTYVGRGQRAPVGWLIGTSISAVLNFAAAAVAAVPLIVNSPNDPLQVSLLTGSLLVGTFDVAMAVLGAVLGQSPILALLPRPMLLPGHGGAIGIATPLMLF